MIIYLIFYNRSLTDALREITHDGDDDLAVSLIVCLTHLYEYFPPSGSYFKILFWVSVSLIQIKEVKIFNAGNINIYIFKYQIKLALSLMETILKVQDFNELFIQGLEQSLMNAREGPIEQILNKLDQMSGLNFKTSFSFAIAGHLLKVYIYF